MVTVISRKFKTGFIFFLVGLLAVGVLSGCSDSDSNSLSGGILVTFDVEGETYKIFITKEDTIEDVFAVQRGESSARIPNGRLVRGSVDYNEPWSWHIDSEDIEMADFTVEVSDGKPSDVEADPDYWIDTVKRFSPWTATITKIEDFR